MILRECVIYENKICDECGDCNFCDVNPDKICDNCGSCLDVYDYSGVRVDKLVTDQEDIETGLDNQTKHHHSNHDCCRDH